MAKKKQEDTIINIKNAMLKNPKAVIKILSNQIPDLKFTKVIQTYVIEESEIKLQLLREGRSFMQGDIVWIGNNETRSDGTVICFKNDKGGDMKQIVPSNDNSQDIILDLSKKIIRMNVLSRLTCSICRKSIEIFDEEMQCPICDAKFHANHFRDWIKAQSACQVCKRPLSLSKTGKPIPMEEE